MIKFFEKIKIQSSCFNFLYQNIFINLVSKTNNKIKNKQQNIKLFKKSTLAENFN